MITCLQVENKAFQCEICNDTFNHKNPLIKTRSYISVIFLILVKCSQNIDDTNVKFVTKTLDSYS